MYGLHRDILLSMVVHVLWRTSHGIMSNNIYNLTHEIDSMFLFLKLKKYHMQMLNCYFIEKIKHGIF